MLFLFSYARSLIQKRYEDTRISYIANPELRFIISKASGYNAEKIASQTVIDWLTTHYPYMIRASKKFYLRKEADSYICGVGVKSKLQITDAKNIKSVDTDQNNYLMLESSVVGDYGRYADMLMNFARDNGMTADKKGVFAVYDAKESFDNPRIKLYCPVKIEKN